MGLFDKIKNALFEEEYVEIEEKPKKPKKDILKNNSSNKPIAKKIVLPEKRDYKIEELDATLSEDGKTLSFNTDKFSTYAIAYVDEILPPKTGDNIMIYVTPLIIFYRYYLFYIKPFLMFIINE